MIQSMTGFGKAESMIEGHSVVIEIRSLNSNKGLDLNIKLPSKFRSLEADWRNEFSEKIIRGKVDVTLSSRMGGSEDSLDMGKLTTIYQALATTADSLGADKNGLLASLIPILPNISSEEKELTEEDNATYAGLLSIAISELLSFRQKEGESIIADVSLRLETISNKLTEVVERDKNRLAEVRTKMAERLESFVLSDKIDPQRLEQEVIFYLEKMDINEEISRLGAHCKHFKEVMNSTEIQLGRKLNFIAQEMGREINTIGSKANDFPLQKLVVEMKDELEKIKEQTSNIL